MFFKWGLKSGILGRSGGGATALTENFRMEQVVPGATPLTVSTWPDYLTQQGDTVTVRTSPTLTPWVPTVVGTPFAVDATMFTNKSMGGALNAILSTLSGSEYAQVQIGSRFSYVTQRGNATPAFTSSSTIGINELATLSFPITLDMPVRSIVVWSGEHLLNYEIVGNVLRFYKNGVGDFEAGATQTFAVMALGYTGKRAFQTLTINLGDVVEFPTNPTFTTVIDRVPGSAAVRFNWTVTGMAAGINFPCAITGASAVYVNGVAVASMAAFTVAQGNSVDIDVLPHASAYLSGTGFALSGGGTSYGGTVSATGKVITQQDPGGVNAAAGAAGPAWSSSGATSTKTFTNQAFEVGRYIIFAFGDTLVGALSASVSGSATLISPDSGAWTNGAVAAFDLTVGAAGTQSITTTAASGNLNRSGILAVKVTNAAAGINDTAKKAGSYTSVHTTDSSLIVGTQGLGLGVFYGDGTAVIYPANGVEIAQFVLSGGRALSFCLYGSTVTPSATYGTSGGPPGASMFVSLNKA